MNNKTPKLRFKGFTDAWEQRKVGELIVESKEKGHTGEQARKLTVKLWGNGVVPKLDKGSKNTQYFIRHKEQFIYSKLDFLNAAFGVIPEELDGFESTADLPTFDCNGIDPYFLFHVVSQPSFYIKNGIIANGSRKAKRIHQETFFAMPIVIPTREEQVRISYFISKLDNLITLHQRKLEKIKSLKKAYLDKMFPKKGKLYPELRFAGFTDAWEQRKLEECLSEITYGFTNPMSDTEDGPWKITAKDIVDGNINYSSARHTSQREYENLTKKSKPLVGDLLLTKDGTLGRTAIVNSENICINQSVALLRFNQKCSVQYVKTLLDTPRYQRQMLDDAGGGTIKHIYITKIDKMSIPIPSMSEQERLVRLFGNLDNLITLHQRKLEKLKQLKTGYLNSMFI